MKRIGLFQPLNIFATATTLVILLISCGPSKEEMEAREKEILNTSNKKYKVGEIVYLKPDSCKGLVLGYRSKYLIYGGDDPQIIYVMRDCHGNEVTIDTDNFIYGKEK